MKQEQEQLFVLFVSLTPEQALAQLKTSPKGLSRQEVARRQGEYGQNILEEQKVHWWYLVFHQFSSIFIYIYIFLAAACFLLGEYINSFIIFLFVLINATVGFYQEYNANQAIQALKKYLVARIRVLRDGKEIDIESSMVVPGDILILYPGDVLPADVRFIEAESILMDESVLTGESAPVEKTSEALSKIPSMFEAKNIGFAGTTLETGKAKGVVFAIAKQTAMGNIAGSLQEIHESSLSKGTAQLSKFLVLLITVTLILIFTINFIRGNQIGYLNMLLFSTALAISAIPEALPVVVTFCLARGATELIKKKVVVKRLSAVEDLGAIEILCTDKTGTLTENELEIAQVKSENKDLAILYGALGSTITSQRFVASLKGFDKALFDYLEKNPQLKGQFNAYKRIRDVPFDPAHRRNVILAKASSGYELISRGSVSDVLAHVSSNKMSNEKDVQQWINQQGMIGNRVLAVAVKKLSQEPKQLLDEENNLELVGFLSFSDPLKPTASQAVDKAKKLGVKIKVLSGDVPEVCGIIAQKIGLIKEVTDVVNGEELEKKSDSEKEKIIQQASVFARVTPQQKCDIIKVLQKDRVVGYMGDGINDAPALKLANVSLAVQDAVDVARAASDIILLKKSLLVIINGIEEGRKIVTNTMKYIKTDLSDNFGNFYALAIASLVINYVPMLPFQILLSSLICDFPLIAFSTDNVDISELKKPQYYNIKDLLLIATLLGVLSTLFDFMCFGFFVKKGPTVLHTCWFIFNILTEMVFIFSIRTQRFFLRSIRPSYPLLVLAILAALAAVILPFINVGQQLFEFVPLQNSDLVTIVSLVIAYFIATETVKCFYYKHKLNTHV